MAKTDNHNPRAKIDLRRYFLRKYHADAPMRVLDCCQGAGLLWRTLREEFEVTSYWGLDLKPKKGRLKLDSVRVLAQRGWDQNVIDVDAYGSPWSHWQAMLPNLLGPTTVFLTRGSHSTEPLNQYERDAIGLTIRLDIPRAFYPKIQLADFAITCCVSSCYDGIILVEAVEAVSDGNARYIGVRLEREQPGANPAAAKRPEPLKEVQHV